MYVQGFSSSVTIVCLPDLKVQFIPFPGGGRLTPGVLGYP